MELTAETALQTPHVLNQMSAMDHEQLVFCQDNQTGLKAIIGIHNTTLGPALGGTRMWAYERLEDAVEDVLVDPCGDEAADYWGRFRRLKYLGPATFYLKFDLD
jgi:hypothetical protein